MPGVGPDDDASPGWVAPSEAHSCKHLTAVKDIVTVCRYPHPWSRDSVLNAWPERFGSAKLASSCIIVVHHSGIAWDRLMS